VRKKTKTLRAAAIEEKMLIFWWKKVERSVSTTDLGEKKNSLGDKLLVIVS